MALIRWVVIFLVIFSQSKLIFAAEGYPILPLELYAVRRDSGTPLHGTFNVYIALRETATSSTDLATFTDLGTFTHGSYFYGMDVSSIATSLPSTLVGVVTVDGETFNVSFNTVPWALKAGSLITPLTSALLASGSVGTSQISDGTVTSTDLSSTGVTAGTYGSATQSAQIVVDAAGRITSASNVAISAGGSLGSTIESSEITDRTIVTADIANDAIGTANILDGTIVSADIADTTIATADLSDSSVTTAKITDGTIATADLADSAVTAAKLSLGMEPTWTGKHTFNGTADFQSTVNISGTLTTLGTHTYTPSTAQALAAAGDTILANARVVRITGPAGGLTLTSNPTIANGNDGQIVTIINVNAGNGNIVLQDGDATSNLELPGGANLTLGPGGDNVTLLYSLDLTRWIAIANEDL